MKYLALAALFVVCALAQGPTTFQAIVSIAKDPEQSGVFEAYYVFDGTNEQTALQYINPTPTLPFLRETHIYTQNRLYRQCPNTCETFDEREEPFPLITTTGATEGNVETFRYIFADGQQATYTCKKYTHTATTSGQRQIKFLWVTDNDNQDPCRVEWGDGTVWTFKNPLLKIGGTFATLPAGNGGGNDEVFAASNFPEECFKGCSGALELIFVLDASFSIRPAGWTLIVDWVRNAIAQFTISQKDTRIGIVSYNTLPELNTGTELLSNPQLVDNALAALANKAVSGFTCIGCGLNYAGSLLFDSARRERDCGKNANMSPSELAEPCTTPIRGPRKTRADVPIVVVTLTDGAVNRPDKTQGELKADGTPLFDDATYYNMSPTTYMEYQMGHLTAAGAIGISIGVIGVDPNGNPRSNPNDLLTLAQGDPTRRFSIGDLDALEGITQKLISVACSTTKKCNGQCTSFCGCDNKCECPTDCSDENPCTPDVCTNPDVGCQHLPTRPNGPNGLSQCDDSNVCTDDICQDDKDDPRNTPVLRPDGSFDPAAPECKHPPSQEAIECTDDNQCTVQACIPETGCRTLDLSFLCTAPDTCRRPGCQPTGNDTATNNGIPGCFYETIAGADCTACQVEVNQGQPLVPVNCDLNSTLNICLGRDQVGVATDTDGNRGDCEDKCNTYTCQPVANTTDDATCVVVSTRNCNDSNVCTRDGCVSTTGECEFVDISDEVSKECGDVNDICQIRWCDSELGCQFERLNETIVCDDGDPCTIDKCNSNATTIEERCVHINVTEAVCAPALNGSFCKLPVCLRGECTFTDRECPPRPGSCELSFCDEANKTCAYVDLACAIFEPPSSVTEGSALGAGAIAAIVVVALVVAAAVSVGGVVGASVFANDGTALAAGQSSPVYTPDGNSGTNVLYGS